MTEKTKVKRDTKVETVKAEDAISVRSHLAIALTICLLALVGSYTGFLPGGRQVSHLQSCFIILEYG